MITVVRVEPLEAYRLRLTFSDGSSGEVDLSTRLWGPVFEPLRDLAYFRRVRVDRAAGTIVWPNGADIAPETLHLMATADASPQASTGS
jgi:hypothetical protein